DARNHCVFGHSDDHTFSLKSRKTGRLYRETVVPYWHAAEGEISNFVGGEDSFAIGLDILCGHARIGYGPALLVHDRSRNGARDDALRERLVRARTCIAKNHDNPDVDTKPCD